MVGLQSRKSFRSQPQLPIGKVAGITLNLTNIRRRQEKYYLNVASEIEVKCLEVHRCSEWFDEMKLDAWNKFWEELFERDRVGRGSKFYIPKHFFMVTGEIHFTQPSEPSPSTLMYDERRNGPVLSVVTTPEEVGEMQTWQSTFYKVIFSRPVFPVPEGVAKKNLEKSSFHADSLTC